MTTKKLTPLTLSLLMGGFLMNSQGVANYSYQNQGYGQSYQNDHSIYQFEAAERASGNPSALYQYENSMRGGLFEAYPAYWRLSKGLSYQNSADIIGFSQTYQGTALAEKLAADYAEEKAKTNDYGAVRAISPYVTNADESEKCAIELGAAQYGNLSLKDEVWLDTTWRRNPIALCDKLGSQMTYNSTLTNTDRHQRLVRLMRIDNRRLGDRPKGADNTKSDITQLASQLNLAMTYSQLSQIASNPNGFFAQFNQSFPNSTNQYLYLYAISQLAHRSYSQAVGQLEYDIAMDNSRSQKLLPEMIRRYAYRAIAIKRMNMLTDNGFDRQALDWFYQSVGEPFNAEEATSFARIAIYYGDWRGVETAIGQMTAKVQNERMWQYWRARSLEGQGNRGQAQSIYANLSNEIDYYGLLAKDRLGQRLSANDVGGLSYPQVNQAMVMSDPYFARAILLMQNNAKTEHINREWNWAVKKARDTGNNALIINAAAMMQSLGNYPRSIYAMENSAARNAAISHPTPYYNALVGYSRNVGIDPAWAYGIIRQESRFQTAAQSSASAQGLMQIIPGTARQIARSLGESVGNMNNPDTNIRYGTWYLADMLRKHNGQMAAATASYNAGASPVQKWLPRHGSIAADQFVEAIPYSETRDYVKKVMANATIYGVVLGNPISISQRMGNVGYY